MSIRPRAVLAVLPLLLALPACGGASGAAGDDDGLQVAASFYPLEWVTQRVAADAAEVANLTPPGVEPHDLELGPRDVATIGEADLVVHLQGFQPAVDDAVEQEAGGSSLDVGDAARLHTEGGRDPHFWLDPTRLADVADAVAARLGKADKPNAGAYADRAREVRADLEALDEEMSTGLAGCASTDLVTGHAAFGYLADRYGMTQRGITGLVPDEEPSPRDLADVTAFVEEHQVRTIYYETLVSPDVAETVARETGATTAVLDPLEGLTDESRGRDYLEVMRTNLATLRDGQQCR
ncbi:MAG: metal ABC transporter substrate-binding protein [Actinomycetes bacterium]